MRAVTAFIHLLREAPASRVALLLLLMIVAGLTEGIGILLLVPLLEILQGRHAGSAPLARELMNGLASIGIPPSAGGLLIAFAVLILLRNLIQHGRGVTGAQLQYQLVDRLRYRCFSALLGAQWQWLAASRRSDHANLLLTDISRVGNGLNFGLSLLASVATMLAYLGSALALSWAMTLLAVLSGALTLIVLSGQRREALRLGQSLSTANRAMQRNVQESLAGLKLAKILGNENRHLDHFRQDSGRLRSRQLEFHVNTSRARALYQTIGAMLLAGYLYIGLSILHTTTAELITLVLVFGRLIPMFSTAQQQYHQWLHALPALEETTRFLTEYRGAAEFEAAEASEPWPVKEAVCLSGVSLRYSDRSHAALDSISLCFKAHTTTAIMGPSGAGKSTLADVLMGLLRPDSGVLRIDGTPVDDSKRRQWRHSVAYVPQEMHLFHDTIRKNLLWGEPQASETDLHLALSHAAADFVFKLPHGLDTVVGDGGIRFSGGERQRLALARALLKKPSLLILDEATSALDLENEARVRQAIENLHGELTIAIIGHRLPTIEHADQVLILNEGKIAAQGTWTEIMAMEPTR